LYLPSAIVFQSADIRAESTLNASPSPSLKRWQQADWNSTTEQNRDLQWNINTELEQLKTKKNFENSG
jgi:hypothetical protein